MCCAKMVPYKLVNTGVDSPSCLQQDTTCLFEDYCKIIRGLSDFNGRIADLVFNSLI